MYRFGSLRPRDIDNVYRAALSKGRCDDHVCRMHVFSPISTTIPAAIHHGVAEPESLRMLRVLWDKHLRVRALTTSRRQGSYSKQTLHSRKPKPFIAAKLGIRKLIGISSYKNK